jgi:hypothetical protein
MTGLKRVARRTCIDCVESRAHPVPPVTLVPCLSVVRVYCCAMWLWPVAIMGVVCIVGVICTWPSHTSVLVDGWVARARQCRWASGRPSPAPLMQLRYVRHTDPVRCTGCVSVCVCARACVHAQRVWVCRPAMAHPLVPYNLMYPTVVHVGCVVFARCPYTPLLGLMVVQVKAFSDLSWDHNPIHLDEAYAATTRFKRCIAHGMLASTMFGTIMATQVPGAVYLNQSLAFKAPVFVGDTVTARWGRRLFLHSLVVAHLRCPHRVAARLPQACRTLRTCLRFALANCAPEPTALHADDVHVRSPSLAAPPPPLSLPMKQELWGSAPRGHFLGSPYLPFGLCACIECTCNECTCVACSRVDVVEVTQRRVMCKTTISNDATGELAVDGQATIMLPKQ